MSGIHQDYHKRINEFEGTLQGFISLVALTKQQPVIVLGQPHYVVECYRINIRYYVATNVISIYRGNDYFNSRNKVIKFIQGIGLNNYQDFLSCFFKDCEFHQGLATKRLNYNQFTTVNPFL